MKRVSVLLLAALIIGSSFAFLLVRVASLEREVNRQRRQIAVMHESAMQAREAFDRTQSLTGLHTFIRANKSLDAEIEKMEKVSKER